MDEAPEPQSFTVYSLWGYLTSIRRDLESTKQLGQQADTNILGNTEDQLNRLASIYGRIDRKIERLKQSDVDTVRLKCLIVCGETAPALKALHSDDFVEEFYHCLEQVLAELAEAKILPKSQANSTSLTKLVELIEVWRKKRRGKPPDDDPVLPQVNLTLSQVRYNGICYDITPECALLLNGIVTSHPQPVSASAIVSNPSRVKKALPEQLQAIIITATGKGYRLQLPIG